MTSFIFIMLIALLTFVDFVVTGIVLARMAAVNWKFVVALHVRVPSIFPLYSMLRSNNNNNYHASLLSEEL